MSLTVTNPSYDRVYTIQAWRDNNIRLVLTQGEGATALNGTVNRIKVPRFQLRDEQGVINLNNNSTVTLALTRPDGSEDLLVCNIITVTSGIIACPITASATAIAGDAIGEIRVTSLNGTIKFYGIHFYIHKGVSDNAAAQSTQFSALVDALQKIAVIEPDGSNTIELDTVIAENGTNPVASGLIYDALTSKMDKLSVNGNDGVLVESYGQGVRRTTYRPTNNVNDVAINATNKLVTAAVVKAIANDMREEIYEILDNAFSGDTSVYPTLLVDNNNAQNHYILYFVDSNDNRRNLFDFSAYFAEKASTLSGYGITNAYTKTQIDTALNGKADKASTLSGYGITDAYTKTQTDEKLGGKADKSTTLAGYGITNAYTKNEADGIFGLRYSVGFDENYIPIKRWSSDTAFDNSTHSPFSASEISDRLPERIKVIYIASRVTSIGSDAFSNCANLTTVYIDREQDNIVIENNAFPNSPTVNYKGYFNDTFFTMRALESISKDLSSLTSIMPVTSWADVQKIVRAGLAPLRFPIGKDFEVERGNETIKFVVRGYDTIQSKYSWMKHSLILEAKNIWVKAQYDAPEALYYASGVLSPDKYWFNAYYDNTAANNRCFQLAAAVPQNGWITFDTNALTVTTYNGSGEIIETCSTTNGSQGTPLTVNHINRIINGSNNYAQSAIRQLLNSAQSAGNVWSSSNIFDRPPTWASSQDGFKRGLDSDFLAVVAPAKIPCITNNVYETDDYTIGSTYEISNDSDRFFILSRAEIFGSGDVGTQLDGYKNTTAAERIKRDGQEQAVNCMLRTPKNDSVSSIYYINTSGSTSVGNAKTSFGVCPACIIA